MWTAASESGSPRDSAPSHPSGKSRSSLSYPRAADHRFPHTAVATASPARAGLRKLHQPLAAQAVKIVGHRAAIAHKHPLVGVVIPIHIRPRARVVRAHHRCGSIVTGDWSGAAPRALDFWSGTGKSAARRLAHILGFRTKVAVAKPGDGFVSEWSPRISASIPSACASRCRRISVAPDGWRDSPLDHGPQAGTRDFRGVHAAVLDREDPRKTFLPGRIRGRHILPSVGFNGCHARNMGGDAGRMD